MTIHPEINKSCRLLFDYQTELKEIWRKHLRSTKALGKIIADPCEHQPNSEKRPARSTISIPAVPSKCSDEYSLEVAL